MRSSWTPSRILVVRGDPMTTLSIVNNHPRTPAQQAASRANGAQSTGPTSENGKHTAQTNRIVHSFRAETMALATEDHPAYTEHRDAYIARYAPQDKVELDLVGLLATNMWQVMRMNAVEVALFDIQVCYLTPQFRINEAALDEAGRLALAFKRSAGDNVFELLRRYKATAERAYHKALKSLEELIRNRPPQIISADRPEPTPIEQITNAIEPSEPPPTAAPGNPTPPGRSR